MASLKRTLTIRPDSALRKELESFAVKRGISLTSAVNIALYETFMQKKEQN